MWLFLANGSLLLGALIVDLAGPTWFGGEVSVSAVMVLFVGQIAFLNGGNSLGWSGAVGLASDLIHGAALGTGVFLFATVALLAALFGPVTSPRTRLMDRCLLAAVTTASLMSLRFLISQGFTSNDHSWWEMAVDQLAPHCLAVLPVIGIVHLISSIWTADPLSSPVGSMGQF